MSTFDVALIAAAMAAVRQSCAPLQAEPRRPVRSTRSQGGRSSPFGLEGHLNGLTNFAKRHELFQRCVRHRRSAIPAAAARSLARSSAPLGVSYVAAIVLISGPALAGAPFRTDDPEPVEFQHFEIDMSSQGTRSTGGWSATLPALEVDYGALSNLALHVIIPQDYTAPADGRSGFALGDIELGAKYRFVSPAEGDWFPQVGVYPLIEVPVGNQKLGFSTGHMQVFLPIWLQKDFGHWTVYGGGGYWINPGVGNKNYGFVGVALWRQVTEELNLGMEVFRQGANAVDGKDTSGFNLGAIYDFSKNWHLLCSIGTGLQNRTATDQLTYYGGLRLTF